jgi:OOP family OmpA-OmpF porin
MRQKLPFGQTLAALALVLTLFVPSSARASEEHAWEMSFLGGYSQYSDKLFYPSDSLADAPVFGVRLSRKLGTYWVLEAAGSYASTHGMQRNGADGPDVTMMNASGSLLGQLSAPGRFGMLYLLGGFGYTQYDSDAAPDNLHYGVLEAAAGWKKELNDALTLRLEARNLLNMPNRRYVSANKADQQYWAGLSFGWGGKMVDTDGDGVADKKDKCPDTPKGATVGLTGCPTDSDGDGVWDGLDKCPDTPKGATVDASGCPVDSDGDGVWDGLDKCPDTPKGATVDASGCPVDSDGDGVFDGIDTCPNTPKGATVDASGCPKDSDSDGVPDGIDQCPNTPAGLKVDSNGCPIEVTEKETQLLDTGLIRLQNVNFETGKAELLPDSYPPLDEVGAILVKWPQLQIEIGGHTDARGSVASNQVLSEARAQSVKDYLTSHFSGIDGSQLSTKGYGESKPLVRNTTALNMAKNRRVEFKVLNREALKKEIERRKMLQK